MNSIYHVDGDRAATSEWAAGPWDPTMQHGAPPAALAVWAAEQLATNEPMDVARVTVDLMRPVPMVPLRIAAEVLRDGRKIQLCQVRLLAERTEVVRASVLKVRTRSFQLPAAATIPALDMAGPNEGTPPKENWRQSNPFLSGMSLRVCRGSFIEAGPGAIWFRADRPIVAGEAISPAMRAVIAADFTNGTSSVLNFSDWTFLNADLSVNFARLPRGEWILVDAETWVGGEGRAVAMARLADEDGYFGRAVQSLVVERRGKP